jgi:hypothetical protein
MPTLFFNPLLVPVGSTAPDGVTALNQCTRLYDDVSSAFDFNWGSADTTIVTVDNYGTHTGILPGSTTSGTSGTLTHYGHTLCPDWNPTPSGGVNVMPSILFGGPNGTDITGKTQSVVVGQQIILYAKYQTGLTVNSQSWSVPGTIVAGYTASSSSGSVNTNLTLNAQQTTPFYWVYAGNPQTVTFTLNYGNSKTAKAQATFNVAGPTGTDSGSPATNQLTIDDWSGNGNCITAGIYLVFGNVTWASGCVLQGTKGISFNANITSNGTTGSAFRVQLVTDGSLSGGKNCTITPGLDTGYPYPLTNDSPPVVLLSSYTTLTRTENFKTYLMWQSNTANSIPVPLGYLPWGFSGSANCSGSCGSAANWTASGSGGPGTFHTAQSSDPNYGYPTWSGMVGGCN